MRRATGEWRAAATLPQAEDGEERDAQLFNVPRRCWSESVPRVLRPGEPMVGLKVSARGNSSGVIHLVSPAPGSPKSQFPAGPNEEVDSMSAGSQAAPLNPGIVFEMVQAHQRTAALKAAIDLDIFSAVGKGPGRCGFDRAALRGIGARHPHSVRFSGDQWRAGERERPLQAHAVERGVSGSASPACMASVAQFLSEPAIMQADCATGGDCARRAARIFPARARLSRRIRFGLSSRKRWRR